MFVVHTVNQLEEAIRVGAEEILVTGGLASNVHEAYLSKACKDKDVGVAESSGSQQTAIKMDSVETRSGIPAWRSSSLMIITCEYAVLDSHLDPRSPSMILQRTKQH